MSEKQINAIRAVVQKWNPDDTPEQIEQQVRLMVYAIENA